MKLYKILELHAAPKDYVTLIDEYIIANNDEEVFEYIGRWGEDFFDDKESEYKTREEAKEEIMNECGDLEDEDGWEDAYYGVTKKGWKEVGEITEEEIVVLKKLKIIKG